MSIRQSYTVIQISPEDLQKFLDNHLSETRLKAFLNRFDNVLIGTNEVANMHNVNKQTVLNYISDGLIVPEVKLSENDHPRFRLSYALTLDFKELQRKLRAKNKGY